MSKFNDSIKRIQGALASFEFATSPKDIAWALRRATSKLPKGITEKLSAEKLIIDELTKDIPIKYKRAEFKTIEDYNHSVGQLKDHAELQVQDFLSKASQLEAEVAAAPQSAKSTRDLVLEFGEGISFKLSALVNQFLAEGGRGESVLRSENTHAEALTLLMADNGVEGFDAEHAQYGVIARAVKRKVLAAFKAPKAVRDPSKPKAERKPRAKKQEAAK